MCKLIKLLLVLVCCNFITALAQTEKQFDEAVMNSLFEKFKKIQADAKARKQYDADLEKLVDEFCAKVKLMTEQKKRELDIITKAYKPGYQHKPGEMNLFPIWEEIPSPIPALPDADRVNFESMYTSYIDKVAMMKKQLLEQMVKNIGEQRSDKQSMMNDSKEMTNQNQIVQQMGGADAVMKMSKAERKAAATRAAADVMSGAAVNAPGQDAGMKQLMQKMMHDPEYRAAYNKMSDAEKEAELKKYMTTTQVERNDAEFEKMLKTKNRAISAIELDQLLAKCLKQMQEAALPYSEGTDLANNFFNGIYRKLDHWYRKQYDALPLGATREKLGLDQLIKCKEIILYAFQQEEAATRTALWGLLKTNTKIAFGEFNDLAGSFPWGKSKNANMIDGLYTEPKVAQAVVSLYDEMIRMAREAERLTRIHKGQQMQYDLIVNGKS